MHAQSASLTGLLSIASSKCRLREGLLIFVMLNGCGLGGVSYDLGVASVLELPYFLE